MLVLGSDDEMVECDGYVEMTREETRAFCHDAVASMAIDPTEDDIWHMTIRLEEEANKEGKTLRNKTLQAMINDHIVYVYR